MQWLVSFSQSSVVFKVKNNSLERIDTLLQEIQAQKQQDDLNIKEFWHKISNKKKPAQKQFFQYQENPLVSNLLRVFDLLSRMFSTLRQHLPELENQHHELSFIFLFVKKQVYGLFMQEVFTRIVKLNKMTRQRLNWIMKR